MENLLNMTLDQITAYAHYIWDAHERGFIINDTQQCVEAAKILEAIDEFVFEKFNTTIKIY